VGGEQGVRRLGVEACELELGQPGAVHRGGLPRPRGDDDGHGVGEQPPRGEDERARRRPVEPLEVVHEHDDGALLGEHAEQPERRRADEVPLAGVHHGQSEGAAQRRRLRCGQPVEDLHDGPQERVQPAEGDVHLRLDAARAEHERVVGRLGRVLEDGGLADPRLPSQHERGALARAGAGQDAVDHVALAVAAEEGHPHSLPRAGPRGRSRDPRA